MSENIKLKSYRAKNDSESDSQQYHEIDQDAILEETTFCIKPTIKHINENDFFTQYNVKTEEKCKGKKKKEKKRKPSNIMDIINSDIASKTPPIRENVITMVNYDKEQKSFYLKRSFLQNTLQRRHIDAERGWNLKANSVNISPVFPKVLENAIVKDVPISLHYVKPYMFKDIVADYTDIDSTVQSKKFLDIEILNMKFTHHHKYSLEKLLLVKLIEHYNEYLNVQKLLKETCKNVKISRDTKNNLKQQLLNITTDSKEDVRFDTTLLKYTGKLFYFKDLHLQMLKKEKEIIHKVLSLWSDVKMVREKSGRVDENYILEVNKVTASDNDYQENWNIMFETEYSDMLDKIEYEYANAYIEYKESKKALNLDGIENKKISKPKLHIDEVKIRTETVALVNKILTKDKTDLVLKCNTHIMKDLLKPIQALVAHDYHFKVFVDDAFVCESELYTCKNQLHRLELFSVQILPKNKIIHIALYENEVKVSSINVEIDGIKQNITQANFIPFNFIYSDNVIYPNHIYVGSGFGIKEIAVANKVRLKSSNLFKEKLITACDVNIKIGWSNKFNENNHEIILDSIHVERQLKRYLHGVENPNINTLIDIINKIYGRNVENDDKIMNALQDICKKAIKSDNTFPINDKIAEKMRLKLIYLRNNGGFVNIENKLVPLFASQISTEQKDVLQNFNKIGIDIQNLNSEKNMDPIDLQRYFGIKYVYKLNENLQKTLNEFLLQKTYKDVVKDFKDLSLRGLLSNESNLMSLSVSSLVMRQQLLKECSTKEQEIQVTVVRAFNLPNRTTSMLTKNDEDSERIAGFKVRPLRPFVKLCYHGISAQSATGIGCYPSWNQTLKMTTNFSTLSSIHVNVYDECRINVDEMGTEEPSSSTTVHYRRCSKWLGTLLVPLATVLTLGTLRGTFKLTAPPLLIGYENTSSKEVRTLIPEVKQLMKKDISFLTLNITTSLSHLGGVEAYSQPVPDISEDSRVIKHLNTFMTEYLNEFPSRSISLTFVDSSGRNRCVTEYLQSIPLPDLECFPKIPKSKSGSALSRSSGVSKSSSSKSSVKRNDEKTSHEEEEDREPTYSGLDLHNWRNEENQMSKMVNVCLRYVSLIPTYEVTEAQVVTLTGLELLKVLYGSPADHTILLASYFLYLGIKCWIVSGLALPRGLSIFVLVKYDLITYKYLTVNDQIYKGRGLFKKNKDYEWHVFDAVAGDRFELREVACPLKTVSHVFNEENIWVNIQSSQDCESVSFDFSKSSDWQPVFDKIRQVQIQPILSSKSLYSTPCEVHKLQETLEAKIIGKVQKWRSRVKTVWNRYCCTLLRESLPQWEYWSFNTTEPRPEPGHRLKQLMITYKMYGFPLNMHYVNTKSVVANVKASAVHAIDDPDVEFAVAVQVFAYPNNVISVWVFLASFTRI